MVLLKKSGSLSGSVETIVSWIEWQHCICNTCRRVWSSRCHSYQPRRHLSMCSGYGHGSFLSRVKVFLRAAPLLTLAFSGPLLPLRQPTPALPPLFALPRAKRPRRPELRKSASKNLSFLRLQSYNFLLIQHFKEHVYFHFESVFQRQKEKAPDPLRLRRSS